MGYANIQKVFLWLMLVLCSATIGAAPGNLANVPLFTQSNAKPNILLHLDSSGSMKHVLVELPYDDSIQHDADPKTVGVDKCASPLAALSAVQLKITAGVPSINGKDLGNAVGEVCFDSSQNYYATLHTGTGSGADILYSGNYLNWYFNPNTTVGTWSGQKPGTRNRLAAAQKGLTALVDSLSNVRVALTKYDGSLGADLLVNMGDIATNKSPVKTAINSVNASGYTPLAESLRDIGRYFANDGGGSCGGGSALTLHPGQPSQSSQSCSALLSSRITNAGPVQYFCQQNFAILTTDGLSTQDRNIHSDLQDYDDDCSAAAQTAGGYSCASYDMKSTTVYENTTRDPSDYLDDVAQALYDVDLRPDLNDAKGNPIKNNLRTYVIGFADEAVKNNPLLIDTAKQGGGEFIYAEDTNKLIEAFQTASQSIFDLIGTSAAVTFNSATLSANSAVYLALFNSSDWSGNLVAYDLNDTTGAITTKSWDAASKLNSLSDVMAVASRTILTFNGKQGIPFRSPVDYQIPAANEMALSQLSDLMTNAPHSFSTVITTEKSANQNFAKDIVNYFRGDKSQEGPGNPFRTRGSRLGDVVHGGPIFVGAPEMFWPDEAPFPTGTQAYSIYQGNTSSDTPAGKSDRPGVVYIGSNDGMLHGFVAENGPLGNAGDEILAYIPKAVFSTKSKEGLHYLSEKTYAHQYYVDQSPTVSDVYLNSQWKTVLVGGLRSGARGIYMLDVSHPASFSEANANKIVIGEFTNADDVDLGYTFSDITVAKMANNRWAAVFGNGYNGDTVLGASGESALFIVFLDPDLSDGWTLGKDYLKIKTGVGTTLNLNGLSTPALVDMSGDGAVDRAYAGDLHGNMWVFDLSDKLEKNWDVGFKSGVTPKPLFSGPSTQAITSAPAIVKNPLVTDSGSNAPNVLVLFGTGQYMANGDNAYLGDQAFYGIWDNGSLTANTPRKPADLQSQVITETAGVRTLTNNTVDYSLTPGWKIDLTAIAASGERVVSNPVVRGDIVYFNTIIPTSATCSFGGTGYQMSVVYASGSNPSSAIFDLDGNGKLDDGAYAGNKFDYGLPAAPSFLGNRRYTPGTTTRTGSEIKNDKVETLHTIGTGRLSWEELLPH